MSIPSEDYILREGKLFESGVFADKNFEMTPEELSAAVDGFSGPIPIDLEHVPTILDGKLGEVRSVRLSADGREMHGTVALPKWLDDLLLDGERKVSATWNRATKALEKLALVRNPRVKDAAIFAAFSVAHPDEAEALFATPRKTHDHTTAAHQAIHDVIRMGYPGVCSGGAMRPPGGPDDMAGMSEADAAYFTDHPQQLKSLKSIHAMTVQNGAKCGSGKAQMNDTTSRRSSMSTAADSAPASFADSPEYLAFKAKLDAAEARAAELAAKLAETSAESAATAAQFAATKAELETARVKQVGIDAKAFALAEITAGRSTAAEYKDLIADFSDAAEADHKSKELVTFSDAAGASVQGTRVDKLRAREAKRQSHGLFSPALGDGELLRDGEKILFNGNPKANDDELTPAERERYLKATPAGVATLTREASTKKGN